MNKKIFAYGINVALSAVILGTNLNAKGDENDSQNKLESLSKLTKTISTIEKYYVDDIKFKDIVDKAIEGLMNHLKICRCKLRENLADLVLQLA